jgi:hypothetical protein
MQYNFEGRYDLVKFIKTAHKAGLFVHLRIGPYICGEWNFGYAYLLLTTTCSKITTTVEMALFTGIVLPLPVW